MLKSYLKSLLN